MDQRFQSVSILGRQPALGLAELESLYGAGAISEVAAGVAGLAMPIDEIDFARLGGSTRLAQVLAVIPNNLWKDVEKQLIKSASTIAGGIPAGSKFTFGLSSYNIPISAAKLGATGLTVKKVVRSRSGLSVRLVQSNEVELGAAQVIHNKLTGPHGAELLVIGASDGSTIIARTTDIQDIESYTLRDRGRPKRDAKVGMLPPKLAQIIINLAVGIKEASKDITILDPFCGTGVVLQEAMLMGYSASGSDIDQRMGDYTIANLDWLWQQFPQTEHVYRGWQLGDATTLTWETSKLIEKDGQCAEASRVPMSITFVASETYLGRPFTSQPEPAILNQTVTEVNLIIKKFLRNIYGQLAANARLCLAVPAWQTAPNRFRHLPLLDSLEELGYNRVSFEHIGNEDLIYFRPDQSVARQLLVLTRK